MIYLDTSYILKCYVNERGSAEVLRLVYRHPGRAACWHGRSEFWSTLHRHLREKSLTSPEAGEVWRQFERDEDAGLWHWLALDQAVVKRACRAFQSLAASIALRASDALHLACAAENGFAEIYSSDKRLLACATHFGISGRDVT